MKRPATGDITAFNGLRHDRNPANAGIRESLPPLLKDV